MYLSGMLGFGDNFYQRAVVREMGHVYLMTSWPQLYRDLPEVRCVKPFTRLRTQAKNAERPGLRWFDAPSQWPTRIGYTGEGSMLESMMGSVGLIREKINFDGPPVAKTDNHPYIVVRPATLRTEWMAAARNPEPRYIAQVIEALRQNFDIISIADLDDVNECAVGELPYADETYHKGELSADELLELVGNASGVVGGVGWLLPAAIAYRVPMLLLYGGWGKVNGPAHTIDRRMDASLIEQVFPDRFCMCNDRAHNCDKTISNLGGHIDKFILRIAEREGASLAS